MVFSKDSSCRDSLFQIPWKRIHRNVRFTCVTWMTQDSHGVCLRSKTPQMAEQGPGPPEPTLSPGFEDHDSVERERVATNPQMKQTARYPSRKIWDCCPHQVSRQAHMPCAATWVCGHSSPPPLHQETSLVELHVTSVPSSLANALNKAARAFGWGHCRSCYDAYFFHPL